jgi:hypothetical protein
MRGGYGNLWIIMQVDESPILIMNYKFSQLMEYFSAMKKEIELKFPNFKQSDPP